MIFHPARKGVAPRIEKTVPASPADVIFAGNERATMQYEMTCGEATLTLTPSPTVFIKTPDMPGIHSYLASQFLECAAVSENFIITGNFDDQTPVLIAASEVQQFADWIRSKVKPVDGKFSTVWIPSDPRDPF